MTPGLELIKSPRKRKRKNEKTEKTKISKTKTKRKQFLSIECPICYNKLEKGSVSSTICGHVYCTDCLIKALRLRPFCPTCRRSLGGRKAHHKLFLESNSCE